MSSGKKLLQINVNKSSPITEHILQVAIELSIDILAIQEPWTVREPDLSYRSVYHPSFKQVLPNQSLVRPRTVFYISNRITATLAPNSPQDPDCIIIDALDIQFINVYNATHPEIPDSLPVLQRGDILPSVFKAKTILLGDFNTHYP